MPKRHVDGHLVGQDDCTVTNISTVPDNRGRPFVRTDMAISGTEFGYVDPVTVGVTRKDLVDVPNLIFPQFGIAAQWVPAVASYSGTTPGAGAGVTVLYPDRSSGTPWNGKAYVIVHGASNNPDLGDLVPRRYSDKFDLNTYDNLFAGLMIDKGYAVIYTRRPASQGGGVPATLDDGTVLDEAINSNVDMVLGFVQVGEKLLKQKLGREPSQVYLYGHSSGVMVGRLINYSGLNIKPNGERWFDGFLMDDAGGGLPLPVGLKAGEVFGQQGNQATFNKDELLFQTRREREQFTKQLDLAHAAYLSRHPWLPESTYLDLKRQNPVLLREEGLASKNRYYEIRDVSHISATTSSPPKTLDIGGLVDSLIDALDLWVRKDVAPPASASDLRAVAKRPAVALPPIACPTGVRFNSPPPGGALSQTGYLPYDGKSLEPVNAQGVLVDVNGNGYRDTMPSMEQAWRQLKLLRKHQPLDRAAYVGCVRHSVGSLVSSGLLSQRVGSWYVDQARSFPNVPW